MKDLVTCILWIRLQIDEESNNKHFSEVNEDVLKKKPNEN